MLWVERQLEPINNPHFSQSSVGRYGSFCQSHRGRQKGPHILYLSNRLTSALSTPGDRLTGGKMPSDGSCQFYQHRDELAACEFWLLYCTEEWHFKEPIFFMPPSWKCTAQLPDILLFSCVISVLERLCANSPFDADSKLRHLQASSKHPKGLRRKRRMQKCKIEMATGLSRVVN